MRLIANRQFCYNHAVLTQGMAFDCADSVEAGDLIERGLAHKADPPRVLYEKKVIEPPEVGPAVPFCDVPVPDAKPSGVAAAGGQVLPEPNVSEPGAANSGRRRGRFGIGKK